MVKPLNRGLAKRNAACPHYTVALHAPKAHTFAVCLRLENPAPQGQLFRLPAWIAGSYMIREFSKHITAIRLQTAAGKPLALTQLSKNEWRGAACSEALELHYEVYAYDLSVRGAYLDEVRGFFNATSLCIAAVGFEAVTQHLTLQAPAPFDGWRIATALDPNKTKSLKNGFAFTKGLAHFTAPNYDALCDSPVEMGDFAWAQFEAGGALHQIAIAGAPNNLDMARLVRDTQQICAAQIALFEPQANTAPSLDCSPRYVFMTVAVGEGYGGLEHRASTALMCKRSDLPRLGEAAPSDGYQQYLGLVSHEYFHTWNVKRIKPAAFVPYDLSRENYTELLWFFEGFTSYYDDLILARTGLISPQAYLDLLAKTLNAVRSQAGRLTQSLANSSFEAWTKYYRQDENSPNVLNGYYANGSLVAAWLDLSIRQQTASKARLDDVMRLLWQSFGRNFYAVGAAQRGVTEADLLAAVASVSGSKALAKQLQKLVQTPLDAPLEKLFSSFGVSAAQAKTQSASLGVKWGAGNKIASVLSGQAAQSAGLSGGDELIALNHLKINAANAAQVLSGFAAGDEVTLHYFCRDELRQASCKLSAAWQPISLKITNENLLRRRWLAGV